MLPRRAQRLRKGTTASRGTFFDTLHPDMTAFIADFAVRDASGEHIENGSANAIELLDVGGVLAEGATIAFGSWHVFRRGCTIKIKKRLAFGVDG